MRFRFPTVKCFTLDSIRSSMLAHRRLNVPPIPANLGELAETITSFVPVTGFYRGACHGDDGSVALVFIHESMMEPLRQSKTLFMDGTFDVS